MKENKDLEAQIDVLLERSVAEIIPSKDALKKKLLSGEKLKIYIGTDATGTSLHLGHATNYIILEKFRKLGHEVIFLIGDFTSRIGDPTDKDAARVQLTRDQVLENTQTWLKQVERLINVEDVKNPVKIVYNHDWLSKLTFEDVIGIASNFTVQRMLERDMFEKRITEGKPIHLHEFFYPLMQGYDSVVLDVDIEMCGNDQKFNALAGRTLLKKFNNKEKFVFITTLLENPKTGEKMMSKSLGTGIFLDWSSEQMFGGIMAQPDENMQQLFVDTTMLEIKEIEKILKEKEPRDAKLRLAYEIVKIYHGEEKAQSAQDNFINTFSKGGIPEDVATCSIENEKNILDYLVKSGAAKSKSDARRKIDQGGVSLDGEKISDAHYELSDTDRGKVLKVGKKFFVKID
jgi:tyrosyl-tRNA synthetase